MQKIKTIQTRQSKKQITFRKQFSLAFQQGTVDHNLIQRDNKFIQSLRLLRQNKTKLQRSIFNEKIQLTQQQFHHIQQIGQKHYVANIVNYNNLSEETTTVEQKCKCGCGRSQGQLLPYCLNIQQLNFLGPGVILFFYYNKRISYLVLFCSLLYGIFSIITNIRSSYFKYDCQFHPGSLPFFCLLKTKIITAQKPNYLLLIQLILGLIMCLIWTVIIRLLRNLGRKKNILIDNFLDSSSDYFILLQNMPECQYLQRDVVSYVNKLWKMRQSHFKFNLLIKSVQIIYDMSYIRDMFIKIQKKGMLISDMYQKFQAKQLKVKQKYRDDYSQTRYQIGLLESKFKQWRKKFMKEQKFRKNYSKQLVFVQFNNNSQQIQFLENYGRYQQSFIKKAKKYLFSFCQQEQLKQTYKGTLPKIYRAPQPSDIKWNNVQKNYSWLRNLIVWIISFLMIGSTFGFLMLLRYINVLQKDLQFINIIIINLLNRITWNILLKIIQIQQNKTKTQQLVSVMNKSYVIQSFNVIFLPIIFNIYYKYDLYGPAGLAGSAHDYQITAFCFMILFNLINIPHRINQLILCIPFLRRLVIRYYYRNQSISLKQIMVNMYQPPKIPLAGLYVYITATVNQAFFFCHIHPINLFYLFGNLIIFYIVNRHLLLRMCKIPDLYDFYIFENIIIYALNIPLFYAAGSFLYVQLSQQQIPFYFYLINLLCILVWLIGSQNPFNIAKLLTYCIENYFYTDNQNQRLHQDIQTQSQLQFQNYIEGKLKKNHKRIQSYYASSPLSQLFNFQRQLLDRAGPYDNKIQQWCESFHYKSKQQRNLKIMKIKK